jgi:triacylglycerol esterase/lipase EstA (alpha/beta hydrolase family)
MLHALSPRRRALVAAVALVVLAAGGGLAALLLPGHRPPAVKVPAVVPVLLVPGYGGTPASLEPLARRLRGPTRPVVVLDLPDRGTGDLDASARVLAGAVDQTRSPVVDLVGYSAGGIVVRAFLRQPGRAAQVRHVVLLGTPNHGAELAGVASVVDPSQCTAACAELVPGSTFLARLNAGGETRPGPDYVSIWTQHDQTVTPPTSALLAGALNLRLQDVCADASVGHGGLPSDPLVQAMVLTELAAGDPVPLSSADCGRPDGR